MTASSDHNIYGVEDDSLSDGSDHALEDNNHHGRHRVHAEESPRLMETPQHSSLKGTDTFGLSLETATTFRDDVRNEWIHAVFGTDFPDCIHRHLRPEQTKSTNHSARQSQQGMGLAGIAPYTAYRVTIPSTAKLASLPSSSPTNEKNNDQPILGISLARLALGLYVRHVQPGSEAWCAGIVPHSVLVSINGMSLLAESSKQALERLWQYEGFLHLDDDKSSSFTTDKTNKAHTTPTQRKRKGVVAYRTPQHANNSMTPSGAAAKHVPGSDSLCVRQPLHMTLIFQGRLYSVVFLSNPPYGIDWAPCGNFALVKRTHSRAQEAGVLKGSIIASISSSSTTSTTNGDLVSLMPKDISEIDHTLAAETLKTLSANGRDVQLTLCIAPSEARSGHWERLWEAQERSPSTSTIATPTATATITNNNNNNNTTTSNGGVHKQSTPRPSSSSLSKSQRPQVSAQLDGVEVRFHPLLFSNAGSPGSNPPSVVAMNSLSQLAFRVAAGELFSFPLQGPRRRYQYYYSQRYYQPCPPLDQPLTELLSVDDALAYLIQYDKANYDEQQMTVTALNTINPFLGSSALSLSSSSNPTNNGVSSRVLSFLNGQSLRDSRRSIESFLLPMLALVRLEKSKDEKLSPLARLLLDMASNNNNNNRTNFTKSTDQLSELCHRMECMAQALDLKELKGQLEMARTQRIEGQQSLVSTPIRRQPRQIPIRVERAPDHYLVSSPTKSTATETTASAMTMSSIVTSVDANNNRDLNKPSRKGLFGLFRKKKKSVSSRKTKSKAEKEQAESSRAIGANHSTSTARTINTRASLSLPMAHSTSSSLLPPRRGVDVGSTRAGSSRLYTPRISQDVLFTNTLAFLKELEGVCLEIEKSLLRSFSQKITGWALQPWSTSKETELAQVTQVMRERLRQCPTLPLLNPIDSEPLVSVDAEGSYILPSAHFPLLLTFDCQDDFSEDDSVVSNCTVNRLKTGNDSPFSQAVFTGKETMYRTKVELVELQGSNLKLSESFCSSSSPTRSGQTFTVHGSVGGMVNQSGSSVATNHSSDRHVWDQGNVLTFDCRSSWGAPETLTLLISQSTDRIVKSDENGKLHYEKEIGYCFVDMASLWQKEKLEETNQSKGADSKATKSYDLKVSSSQGIHHFDEHGDLLLLLSGADGIAESADEDVVQLRIKVTTQQIPLTGSSGGLWAQKTSLLYKHDDDVRQELFAIEFIKSCDAILKSCGLDLKLLTFRCIPVAERRGFIEWVHGSVPLSEICQPFAGSILDGNNNKKDAPPRSNTGASTSDEDPLSSVAKAGLTKYESLHRAKGSGPPNNNQIINPIQEYLRAFHYDPNDPYMIRKTVMETYVKSCAGYCAITYILGVGDRHLDNLLLHPTGHFFHCDYSFILGHDPKKYLPLRITEDMVNGMGGRDSDNYVMFLSMTCAAFLIFRRPENVRHLMSFVRLMEGCCTLPSSNTTTTTSTSMDSLNNANKQALETAMLGIRERLKLDLTDEEAISFMEKLIEESCSSRMWLAVDAIHTLGKRF